MKESRAKSKPKARTRAGQSILRGAREALAFARGARAGYVVHVPAQIDVKAIREKARMTQDEFARRYGFSKRSLEQWEQGRRIPTGASRAFLAVIAREPEAVHRALASAPR
jgi:putative transcriptional regulator